MFKSFFKKSEVKKDEPIKSEVKKDEPIKSEVKKDSVKKSESKKNGSKKLSNSKRIDLYNKIQNKSNSKKNKVTNINLGENYKEVSEFDNTKITLVQNPNLLKDHNFPSFKYIGTDGFMSIQFDIKKNEAIQVNNGMLNFKDTNLVAETKTNSIMKGILRKLSGSSFLFTIYQNPQETVQRLNLSGPFIGNIYAFYIPPNTNFYTTESTYVCATPNVSMYTKFQFGGFLTGYGVTYVRASTGATPGLVWISSFGSIIPMIIKPTQSIDVDNGILLGFGDNVKMDTRIVSGLVGLFFDGEGLVTRILNNTNDDMVVYLQSKSMLSFNDYIKNAFTNYSLLSFKTNKSTMALIAKKKKY